MEYSQSAYKNEMYAPRNMEVMGGVMKKYFEGHIEVTYEWAAVNPSAIPDPVTSFVSEVSFKAFDINLPMSLERLAEKIMTAFAEAVIRHPAAWKVPLGVFGIVPLILPKSPSADTALMSSIIKPVCDWAKTLISAAPLSGSHEDFVGRATMVSIR